MASTVLNSKISFGMFASTMLDRFNIFLASQLTAEEKLGKIIEAMEKDVQSKRVLARQIGGQMRAIEDPDTKGLEPLEALKARREKLVALGGRILGDPAKQAQLGQLQQEIKGIDAQIKSHEATLATLKESYALAKGNYQEALAALETVKSNGPAMLKAIEAHKQAIAMRDKVSAGSKQIDTSFLGELEAELGNAQAELRSDKAIEDDLDATNPQSINKALAEMDATEVDAGLMAEFQAAAAKK